MLRPLGALPNLSVSRLSLDTALQSPLVVIADLRQVAAAQLARWQHALSDEEKARHARFHFTRDRDAFAAGRGLASDLLAHWLGVRCEQVRFEADANGKPTLRGIRATVAPSFNWAHSGVRVAVALAPHGDVGVDVEDMTVEHAGSGIAERFFADTECRQLQTCGPAMQQLLFYRFWTLKEAFIKGVGLGLRIPLDAFRFDLRGNEVALEIDASCKMLAGQRSADWHFWNAHDEDGGMFALAWKPAARQNSNLLPPRVYRLVSGDQASTSHTVGFIEKQ